MNLSKFKSTMNMLSNSMSEDDEANKINNFADSHGLVLFFKKGEEYFGASEDARVVFAKLKKPDDDVNDGWEDEANFSAINLTKLVNGNISQHVFSKNDIKNIKIMERDKVIENLKNSGTSSIKPFGSIRIIKISNSSKKDAD